MSVNRIIGNISGEDIFRTLIIISLTGYIDRIYARHKIFHLTFVTGKNFLILKTFGIVVKTDSHITAKHKMAFGSDCGSKINDNIDAVHRLRVSHLVKLTTGYQPN